MKKLLLTISLFLITGTLLSQTTNEFFIDFGKNDATNGNITIGPDGNGNHWNNIIDLGTSTIVDLVNKSNTATNLDLQVTSSGFNSNGILNGGLLSPDANLLGGFAVATATQDYFFVNNKTASFKLDNLDASKAYILEFFATRENSGTRTTSYTIKGFSEETLTLQTSGAGIGDGGYNGNNNKTVKTSKIRPDSNGAIIVDVKNLTSNFGYIGVLKINEEQVANSAPIANAGLDQTLEKSTINTTLSGSGSDADADTLTYLWEQTTGDMLTIAQPNQASTAINGLEDDKTYTFKLTVSDGALSHSDDVIVSVTKGSDQKFLIDFGKNDGTNGNITTSPDGNGNYWNNMFDSTTDALDVNIINTTNVGSNIKASVLSNFSSNGINHGGLLSPEESNLGDLAVATATQDYFFTTSSAKIAFDGLDKTKAYIFKLFGTRNNTNTRETKYTVKGGSEDISILQTSGTDLGGAGYNGNNSTVITTPAIRPDFYQRITIEVGVESGSFAYLGLVQIEEVTANIEYLVDFGKDDATNGNTTLSPDTNGNYWNNLVDPATTSTAIDLIDNKNNTTDAKITVRSTFSNNGINHGGLLAPDEAKLDELAIATATQDYFFKSNSDSGNIEISGLKTDSKFIFTLFGTRNSTATRITEYTLTGTNTNVKTLQTSGTDIGGAGYHGNNSTVVVSDEITPDANGEINITIKAKEGGFSYLGLFKMVEVLAPVENGPICASVDDKKITFMGSSVAKGYGSTNGNRGYAYRHSQLLDQRFTAGFGLEWSTENVSVGGNDTVDALGRFDDDLLPLCGKYVVFGLSLGNEGIQANGQAAFDQFKTNMQVLIQKARDNGLVPLVVNCYARNNFDNVEYTFTKDMNLLIHEWDVPSINVLGAIDNGVGQWADGHWFDGGHPNNTGYTEMAYSFVPSLFDALDAGKTKPSKVANTYLTIDKSTDDYQLDFTPDAITHSYTYSFDIKTTGNGVIGGVSANNGLYKLKIDKQTGKIVLKLDSNIHISGVAVMNDDNWHKVTLTHYYGLGKTILYVDGLAQGSVNEKMVIEKSFLSAEGAPATADYREMYFYRAAMTPEEINAVVSGKFLKSSLELYAPLDGQAAVGNDPYINLAQSTNNLVKVDDYVLGLHTDFNIRTDFNVYSNPSNGDVNISFEIKKTTDVTIKIFDLNGREIDVLSDKKLPVGKYTKTLKPNTSSGIYFCRLILENGTYTKKIMIK